MTEAQRQAVQAPIRRFCLPRYHEIPTVGLYLEQVTRYVSEYLNPLQQNCITNSMVSNYVKKDLIPNPQKKQYGRDRIAYLIFIAIAKSVLSLEDIRYFINMHKDSVNLESAYDHFCDEFERVIYFVFGIAEASTLPADKEDAADEENMLHSAIIAVSHKIYLEKCFEVIAAGDGEESADAGEDVCEK